MERFTNGFLDQLRFLLSAGNIRAALEHLNLQSRLRFTALHRFRGPDAGVFMLVDRDDARPPTGEWIERHALYRTFVEAKAGVPMLGDAAADFICTGHPACDTIRTYCGLPLVAEDGEAFGTLCQFDLVPVEIEPFTITLMREVAAALSPTAVREACRAYLEGRVDRLSDMQDVIAAASDAGEDARLMFDSFADPLRAEAFRKLDPGSALALEARISAIWSNVSTKR